MELIDTIFTEKYSLINDYVHFNETYKKCLDEKPKFVFEEGKNLNEKCQV
jgi:hypothetical protein